jgi:hypothetical protein
MRSKKKILKPCLPNPASIKLIGLGGAGGIVARFGALFLASLGGETRMVLIDGDAFEPSNASRMIFGAYGNKAAVMRDELRPRFADTALSLIAIEEFVTRENIGRLIHDGDVVLLTVDNHATRNLVNAHCAQLTDICLISGGNDGVGKDGSGAVRRGTYGNVQAYVRHFGRDITPALTHHHPEIAHPADRLPTERNCTELLTAIPQILFANLAVASVMLNTLWLYLCGALHYGEAAFDIAEALMRPLPLPKKIINGSTVVSVNESPPPAKIRHPKKRRIPKGGNGQMKTP